MLDEQTIKLVKEYLRSNKVVAIYYMFRIWLLHGAVSSIVTQYRIESFAKEGQTKEEREQCGYFNHKPMRRRVKVRNEFNEEEIIDEDWLESSDVVLMYYVYNELTGQYQNDPDFTATTIGDGGGDFGGDGAGGSCENDSY